MAKATVIRILQVGDVHYPGATKARAAADIKRDPFDVSDAVAPEGLRFQKITQSLLAYSDRYFDAIAFMGDFTTGNPDVSLQMEGLEQCLDYLDRNVVHPLLGSESHARALFVPGNHDVDRTMCPSPPTDFYKKFEHYEVHLARLGQAHNSLRATSRINIPKEESKVSLFGINTCLGCGEFLAFPQKTKDDLLSQLEALLIAGASGTAADIIDTFFDLTERLDAPLIDAQMLNDLDSTLNSQAISEPNAIQVVVGHHNLLPQFVPRVALFSELMNSGSLRAFLSGKDRPICYLHGHIHADPIEVVFDQNHPDGCVISISAPEFSDGYNILEFHFDEDNSPLGVVVQPVKQNDYGKLSRLAPRRVPFRQGRHRLSALTELARKIFYGQFAQNAQLHFNDIAGAFPECGAEAVEEALLELEWLELVQIANRHKKSYQWNISSAV